MNIKDLAKKTLQVASRSQFVFRFPSPDSVFLTFDDGPDEQFTQQVLDILQRFEQPASFFMIGERVDQNPEIVRTVYRAGHRIGLHTHSHRMLDEMDEDAFVSEVKQNQRAIHDAIGETTAILRPPRGRFHMRNLLWARRASIQLIHFTITSNDWKATSKEDVLDSVRVDQVMPGDIISFHDTNPYTVEALPIILDQLAKKQLRCRSIARCCS